MIYFQNLLLLPSPGAQQTLSPKQLKVIHGFIDKTEQLLSKIAPKGHRFLRSTKHVLDREKNWIDWKDRGVGVDRCPSLSIRLFLKQTTDKKLKNYVDVEGGDTISALKQRVADKLGIPIAEQRLAVGGTELREGKLVCDYPIPSKTVLNVDRVEPQMELPVMRKRENPSQGSGTKRVRLGTDELTRLWNCGSTDVDGALFSPCCSMLCVVKNVYVFLQS